VRGGRAEQTPHSHTCTQYILHTRLLHVHTHSTECGAAGARGASAAPTHFLWSSASTSPRHQPLMRSRAHDIASCEPPGAPEYVDEVVPLRLRACGALFGMGYNDDRKERFPAECPAATATIYDRNINTSMISIPTSHHYTTGHIIIPCLRACMYTVHVQSQQDPSGDHAFPLLP
jgi:hypothetical protein